MTADHPFETAEDELVRAARLASRLLGLPGRASRADDPGGDPEFVRVHVPIGEGEMLDAFVWAATPMAQAIDRIVESITNDISETALYWGVQFPRCPGHSHPADLVFAATDVSVRCPASGAVLAHEVLT